MVDTVKFSISGSQFRQVWPRCWRENERTRRGIQSTSGATYGEFVHRTLDDLQTGIRVHGDFQHACVVEGSLSRTLLGNNGRMLKNQAELDLAIATFLTKADEVITPPGSWLFKRIDLCFQFLAPVRDFIRAHETYRYPGIRLLPLNVRGESLTWGSRKSDLLCRMYDKGQETKGPKETRGRFLRVEFELRGERMRREFGSQGLDHKGLSFASCYAIARRLALQFSPRPVPKPTSVAEFLSIAQSENWQFNGISAFDLYTEGLTERHINRLRLNMAKCIPKTFAIDWHALLPEGNPPTAMLLDLIPALAETPMTCPPTITMTYK